MSEGQDIGYAVTVTTGGYWTADLYVVVPSDPGDAEGAARESASRTLRALSYVVPAAKLEITAVRRVS